MKNLLKIKDLLNKSKNIYVLFFSLITIVAYSKNPFPPHYKKFLEECDACGCSNNGGSLGMGGIVESNFIGIRYLHQRYESKDGIFDNSPVIKETFNTIQLWSRIPIVNKIELQVFVPYHFHNRNYDTKDVAINGLGDITILSNYTILNKKNGSYNEKDNKVSSSNHLLKFGLGVKLPTGNYNEAINKNINPSFQLGTGSVDYISNIQYVYKYNDIGFSNTINYYYKTSNKRDYKFGNQLNFNSALFYVLKDNLKHSFVPSLGVSGEFYEENENFNLKVINTKGHAIFSNLGFEYNTENLTFGALAMYPINQNLAEGAIKVKYRTSLYLNYNF